MTAHLIDIAKDFSSQYNMNLRICSPIEGMSKRERLKLTSPRLEANGIINYRISGSIEEMIVSLSGMSLKVCKNGNYDILIQYHELPEGMEIHNSKGGMDDMTDEEKRYFIIRTAKAAVGIDARSKVRISYPEDYGFAIDMYGLPESSLVELVRENFDMYTDYQ